MRRDPVRLRQGALARLGPNRDLFERDSAGGFRQTTQVMIEPLSVALARLVAHLIESADEDSVSLLDLTGIVEADAEELVNGIRQGIRDARPTSRFPASPPWTAGRRFLALRWIARPVSRTERSFRSLFLTLWELTDRKDPKRRLPIALLSEGGASTVGHLPTSLAAPRLDRITSARELTYHMLGEPPYSRTIRKALGRDLLRYRRLGLVVPREFAGPKTVERLQVADPTARGRPQVWESVPAAAEELFRR